MTEQRLKVESGAPEAVVSGAEDRAAAAGRLLKTSRTDDIREDDEPGRPADRGA